MKACSHRLRKIGHLARCQLCGRMGEFEGSVIRWSVSQSEDYRIGATVVVEDEGASCQNTIGYVVEVLSARKGAEASFLCVRLDGNYFTTDESESSVLVLSDYAFDLMMNSIPDAEDDEDDDRDPFSPFIAF